MKILFRSVLFFVLVAVPLVAAPGVWDTKYCEVPPYPDTKPPDGSPVYLICPGTKPVLVIYAHGYVNPNVPLGIPWDQLNVDANTYIPQLVNVLGFSFAATSYPKNGLAIVEGVKDISDLLAYIKPPAGTKVYVIGVSEGALVATKALETDAAGQYSGAMALCGPIGDFRKQINYFGDFRALYDYYFASTKYALNGSPIQWPGDLPDVTGWTAIIQTIKDAQKAKWIDFMQPYNVLSVPVDLANIPQSAIDVLRYSIFATNDAQAVLGGNPFDNRYKWYSGSYNDLALNWRIGRYPADPAALAAIQAGYQTTGRLRKPLITMHTTGDPVVPYWHMNQYGLKVLLNGSLGNYVHVPVLRYGHCAFTPAEVLFGFALLLGKTGGVMSVQDAISDPVELGRFNELERQFKRQIQ